MTDTPDAKAVLSSDPNATPDALRKLANLILRGVQFQEIAVAEALRSCASAWASEVARRAAAEKDIVYLAGEVSEGSDMQTEATVMWARYRALAATEEK